MIDPMFGTLADVDELIAGDEFREARAIAGTFTLDGHCSTGSETGQPVYRDAVGFRFREQSCRCGQMFPSAHAHRWPGREQRF